MQKCVKSLGKVDMNRVFSRYIMPFKREGMTRKMVIALVDKGTNMILKDHIPDNLYSSELMSWYFSNCSKGYNSGSLLL